MDDYTKLNLYEIQDYISAHKKETKSTTKSLEEEKKKEEFQELLNKLYLSKSLQSVLTSIELFEKEKKIKQNLNLEKIDKILESGHIALEFDNNICFYGLGDKEKLVSKYFREFYKEERIILEIKGYDKSLLASNIFLKILLAFEPFNDKKIMEYIETNQKKKHNQVKDIYTSLKEICKILDLQNKKILIIFHTLDCFTFYSKENLEYLSLLASETNVNFISTLDSINYPYIISRDIFNSFFFIYFELNSYIKYSEQLYYLDFFFSINQKNKSLKSIKGIMESLTPTQRDLVLFVLEKLISKKEKFIEENELWKEALFEMKTSSLIQFRQNLKEAIIHNIISTHNIDKDVVVYKTRLTEPEVENVLTEFGNDQEDED